MYYFALAAIGVAMGVFGGLLGIGGSIVMIPALVFAFGENEHLYQAAAMICNFFVGAASAFTHKQANILVPDVLKWLIPSAAVSTLVGVALSNSRLFAGHNSYLLARIYGIFLLYVVVYNLPRFRNGGRGGETGFDISGIKRSVPLTILAGILTGIPAGLVGIGGGVVAVPVQQFFLKMPLKRAISNSAATIAAIALIGALYKNLTLPQHAISIIDSLKIAAFVTPGAVVGAYVGSRIMHRMPVNFVRALFVVLAALASWEMLTVAPGK